MGQEVKQGEFFMKKIFIAVLIALIGFYSFAEKKQESEPSFLEVLFDGSAFVNFGLGFPQTAATVSMSGNDKLYMSGFMVNVQTMSIKQNTMVLLLDFELGANTTKNLTEDTNSGVGYSLKLGIGKAFFNGTEIKEKPFYFGVAGLVGYDSTFFSLPNSATATISAFCLGGDVFAIWQMYKKFCIFADIKTIVGFGFLETGSISWGLREFKFTPTIGASIKLK